MLQLEKFKTEEKISLKSLIEFRIETKKREDELAKAMYKLRGKFPKPANYADMRNEMSGIKEILKDISNCLSNYRRYGNMSHNEVIDDRKVIDNKITFPKGKFNPKKHRLAVKWIRRNYDYFDLVNDVSEVLFSEFEANEGNTTFIYMKGQVKCINHSILIQSFYDLSNCTFESWTEPKGRIVYGYIDEKGNFFETDKI